VVVAVLDTGIDAGHPAFTGLTLVEEDFTGSGNGDRVGHGTHCAGTVLGRDVDGTRIGVARGVSKALIGKVLGDDGRGSSEAMFQGIQWAVQNGARVVSISIEFDFPAFVKDQVDAGTPADLATSRALAAYRANLRMFDTLLQMIRSLEPFGAGGVVVGAAGNGSHREVKPDFEIGVELPAAADGVVSVAALAESPPGAGDRAVLQHFRSDQRSGGQDRVGQDRRRADHHERHHHGLPACRWCGRPVVGGGLCLAPAGEPINGDRQASGRCRHRGLRRRRRGRRPWRWPGAGTTTGPLTARATDRRELVFS
jgi:hypothetical protein